MKCILVFFLGLLPFYYLSAQPPRSAKAVVDAYGAIVRGDTLNKNISLVFTGHEFADGGSSILKALKSRKIPGSFFFTGDFYANPHFSALIKQLKKEGHYLGAHSNHHLLYVDWENRDSTLVTKDEFIKDLQDNYDVMARFGIKKNEASWFLPPYEWYNSTIVGWTGEMNLTLINFSSGTRSNADYTYPEMEGRYIPTEDIYQSILNFEKREGMNGFILLVHVGTDPRRKDKLYDRLDPLIDELKKRGYTFLRIDELLR